MESKKLIPAVVLLGGTLFHIALGAGAIRSMAPTYDEPVHLTAGAVYLKTGDHRMNGFHHPPFSEMWAALPLLIMKPLLPVQHPAWLEQKWTPGEQYEFADTFLYRNRISPEALIESGRAMQLAMSVLFGLFLFVMGWKLLGVEPAVYSFLFWAASPAFLTQGTIVSTDLAFAVFFFSFFAGAYFFNSKPAWVAAGASLGLCFASKYFALAVIPAAAGIQFVYFFQKKVKDLDPRLRGPSAISKWTIILGTGLLVFLAAHQFQDLDVFAEGLRRIVGRSQTGRSSFLWGRHGTEGWLHYFPIVFLIKTPLAHVIALALAYVLAAWKKERIPPALWIPPMMFFLLSCFSKVQIGHRHLLAVYPFLFLIAGRGLVMTKDRWRILPAGLFLWLFASVFGARPYFLAYFNELIGGPSNGYKYLTDSNLDWGQELKNLKAALTKGEIKNGIYLSYFGVADPRAYGLRYLDVGSDSLVRRRDDTGDPSVQPTTLAISATNLQATYYVDKTVFQWLSEKTPRKVLGHSLFIYDFSEDPEALKRLERLRVRS